MTPSVSNDSDPCRRPNVRRDLLVVFDVVGQLTKCEVQRSHVVSDDHQQTAAHIVSPLLDVRCVAIQKSLPERPGIGGGRIEDHRQQLRGRGEEVEARELRQTIRNAGRGGEQTAQVRTMAVQEGKGIDEQSVQVDELFSGGQPQCFANRIVERKAIRLRIDECFECRSEFGEELLFRPMPAELRIFYDRPGVTHRADSRSGRL